MDSDTKLEDRNCPSTIYKTVDDPTSTSEHLDAWELTNRYFRILNAWESMIKWTFFFRQIWLWNFWQNHGFGGCSLNLRTICVEFCFLNFWKLLFC
ncbi:hypothetical protein RCL_jg13325.t1 [Rhizophagus clarus]|uniref:Uncharacterized protein n=1 Tax=Rhizophagus clarus TaxID=94130 RepID=A0A8H3LNH4_9GLOM|nr:hypothetical protein RCL_jg13325.t1 [Rhizophagus clarus]